MRARWIFALIAAMGLIAPVTADKSVPQYTVTELPGVYEMGHLENSDRFIVGGRYTPEVGMRGLLFRANYWRESLVGDLLGDTNATLTACSNTRAVGFTNNSPNDPHHEKGFVWMPNRRVRQILPQYNTVHPYAISGHGDITGNLQTNEGRWTGFRLRANGQTEVSDSVWFGADIADDGTVAGYQGNEQMVTWDTSGRITPLGTGTINTINNRKQVGGKWMVHGPGWGSGFVHDYRLNTTVFIGKLPGDYWSQIEDINDLGLAVGWSGASGVLFDSRHPERGMTELTQALVNNTDGAWVIGYATSINNGGEIVGFGTKNGATAAYLLRPVR